MRRGEPQGAGGRPSPGWGSDRCMAASQEEHLLLLLLLLGVLLLLQLPFLSRPKKNFGLLSST